MSLTFLRLTPHNPIIARDGRPFGEGSGQSRQATLAAAVGGRRFAPHSPRQGTFPTRFHRGTAQSVCFAVAVARVFPTVGNELYLPAPYSDAVTEPSMDCRGIKTVHRVLPQPETPASPTSPRTCRCCL